MTSILAGERSDEFPQHIIGEDVISQVSRRATFLEVGCFKFIDPS